MKPKSTPSGRRRDALNEEIEFTEAMERYRQESRRPFPTWSEVLEVLRSLGYSKRKEAGAREANGDWQRLCAELKEERDRLHRELLELRDDHEQCRKAVGILMQQDVEFDEDELLAQVGKVQSIEEFIEELEAEGAS
jgi:hypothetical protein